MPSKSFRGELPPTVQEKLHLSTNDGLTGYRIKNFEIIPVTLGAATELVCKVYTKSQEGSIGATIDFSQTDLLAAAYYSSTGGIFRGKTIIFDNETFNQDIYVTCADAGGSTVPCNFYIELEQFKLDLNASTYHTLKNIRSKTQA